MTSSGTFCLWQYRQSLDFEKLDPKERELRIARGNVSKAQFDEAVRDSSTPFCQDLLESVEKVRRRV